MGRNRKWENRRAAELTAQGVPAWEAMDQATREAKRNQRINAAKRRDAKAERKRRARHRKLNAGQRRGGLRSVGGGAHKGGPAGGAGRGRK